MLKISYTNLGIQSSVKAADKVDEMFLHCDNTEHKFCNV